MTQTNTVIRTRMPIVLASGSPRRSEILRRAGFPFTTRPVDVDEDSLFGRHDGADLAVELSRIKAEAATAVSGVGECVITADTVVLVDGRPLAKPNSAEEARSMLRDLRCRSHEVVTGMTVAANGALRSASATTLITFRDYSDDEIDSYIETGSPMDKAGAYGIQDQDFAPASGYRGCYLNVVGLPLCGLAGLLADAGVISSADAVACGDHRR